MMADEPFSPVEDDDDDDNKKPSSSEDRIDYDENDDNGLIIKDKYIPEELLGEILFHVDAKNLLNCQLVCKRWNSILRSYVWRKKSESVIGRQLHYKKSMPWHLYYLICLNKSLERNLVKNHSGKSGFKKTWKIVNNGGHKWRVECPPIGVPPLPSDPVFENGEHCFVTSFGQCTKSQTVDLVGNGLLTIVLDKIQPPIVVSEWYSCRWDCPAIYECSISLIDEAETVLDVFNFRDELIGENQNEWFRVEHEFTNYGPGLRKVIFQHGGVDRKCWAGHYGSKMAGACVKVNLPKQEPVESEEAADVLLDLE